MIPLAGRFTEGVQQTGIDRPRLALVDRGSSARGPSYRYTPAPPRTGGESESCWATRTWMAYLHLALLNRGVLMTPFHNMALMSPRHDRRRCGPAHGGVRRGGRGSRGMTARKRVEPDPTLVR